MCKIKFLTSSDWLIIKIGVISQAYSYSGVNMVDDVKEGYFII